jgi:mannose-6-phosphate isomerase-like protein (cupin superfamily)
MSQSPQTPAAVPWATRRLAAGPDVTAPDGSDVRLLAVAAGGSMAHFSLAPGRIAAAVAHRTVEELWFVVSGRGRIWRFRDGAEAIDDLVPGVSLSIPVGTRFQFRCDGDEPLAIVGVTLPPWPGPDEAYAVDGPWVANAGR